MGPQVIMGMKIFEPYRDQLKTIQSLQKIYTDLYRREMEFYVGDYVFFMVSLTRFGIKGKLALGYVRPFKIVERISDVAYCLNLPPQLSHVHNVLYVSMLKKYTPNPSHIFSYVEIPHSQM